MSEIHEVEEVAKRRMPENLRRFMLRVQGGKMYLPAAYRIVWFRDECPEWGVTTNLIEGGQEAGFATVQAMIHNGDGRIIASGMKTETRQDFPAGWVEKAETGAVARALAIAGFGTQFSEDLDSDQNAQSNWRPADSPNSPARRPNGNGYPQQRRNSDPEPYRHEREDGQRVHHKQHDPATNRPVTPQYRKEAEPENPHYAPRSTEEDAVLGKHLAWLGGWMTSKKLDKTDRELAIHLLNMAAGHDDIFAFWQSRKNLSEEDWAACKKTLIGVKPAELNKWVQAYVEAKNDNGDSPFSDEKPSEMGADGDGDTLFCPACRARGPEAMNCGCTHEQIMQARADAEGAALSGTLIDVEQPSGNLGAFSR